MSKDISREKDKLRLLWKEKRKKLSLNFTNDNKKYFFVAMESQSEQM